MYKNDMYLLCSPQGMERFFGEIKSTNPSMEITIKGEDCQLKTVKINECEDISVWRNTNGNQNDYQRSYSDGNS